MLSEQEVAGLAGEVSNWGRWGPEDELGTLNFIGDQQRREALALARLGRIVSLSRQISLRDQPGLDDGRHQVSLWEHGAQDFIGPDLSRLRRHAPRRPLSLLS